MLKFFLIEIIYLKKQNIIKLASAVSFGALNIFVKVNNIDIATEDGDIMNY